jgi:serine/threonine protein kinase
VAIKVLPSHLADNPDLKQRFEREARAVSSLNHPHICTLYEFDTQDGTDFLVMEYIEGESLADRLKKGTLPLDQALRHGIEIADALDKAHRQGVVHRDLKPGNIMITKSGAKLLDFGLAKLKTSTPGLEASVLSALPTEEKPLTEKGSILGTFQYMAPEQLEGKDVDARTDIFAFGSLLYEMVTGKRAFEGKSQASLISAIMSSEPRPISQLKPMTPSALDWTVRRCLEKGPENRWQSANDLTAELAWIAQGGEAPTAAETKSGIPLLYAAAMLVGLLLAGLAGWQLRPLPSTGSVTRFSMILPPSQRLTSQSRSTVALSPDGTELVYVANEQLYRRQMHETDATPIQGTYEAGREARNPLISPDGRWVAFCLDNEIIIIVSTPL